MSGYTRTGSTPVMSKEDTSGHMNYDYSHPTVIQTSSKPGGLRGVETNTARGVMLPVVIQDVTGEAHGTVTVPDPGERAHFKVREG